MGVKIGFLTFGSWKTEPGSSTCTATDALLQTIELAQAAEEIGFDGAFLRIHHYEQRLASPFPLLSAIAAKTKRIAIGTAVIDMRYENPFHLAEEAAAADLISAGRLQIGLSRGAPGIAVHGPEAFGYQPVDRDPDADRARHMAELFLAAISGAEVDQADPNRTRIRGGLTIQPQSPGLAERIWWGAGTRATGQWAARLGMNLQSSTRMMEETGLSFDQLQEQQIRMYREAWAEQGHERAARVSVSRSVLPVTGDLCRAYPGWRAQGEQTTVFAGVQARFGKTFEGEPDLVASELAADAAVRAADMVLFTVSNELGVDCCTRILEVIAEHVAPAIGWSPGGASGDGMPRATAELA
ncbi:MAG: LLM class flavin-dependent oxidoreductase [Streptosporangiaceae bacterium]|nr:LLM class flavin-dependent oxidoreductase [Streptosporangiaceae bacterium]